MYDSCTLLCFTLETDLNVAISSFRAFLSSILHPANEDDVPRRRAILREYLDSQQPRNADDETEYLPNLMQAWNFAASSNSDSLLSAVASAIDQLLKLLSTNLEHHLTPSPSSKTHFFTSNNQRQPTARLYVHRNRKPQVFW